MTLLLLWNSNFEVSQYEIVPLDNNNDNSTEHYHDSYDHKLNDLIVLKYSQDNFIQLLRCTYTSVETKLIVLVCHHVSLSAISNIVGPP